MSALFGSVGDTVLSGPGGEVRIGDDHPFAVIGERINPSGRNKLTEQFIVGDYSLAQSDAVAQVEAGARVLDLNAGIPGYDEAAMLTALVKAVHEVVDVPLCIDSSTPEALEAAIPVARGKVLINSVTAEQESMDRLLPLVAKYGTAVVGMVNDEEGPSMDPRVRLACARKIVSGAADHGISADDVVIDPMAPDGAASGRYDGDVRNDPADPHRARREHLLRCFQHLLRDARPPRDRRGVPAARDPRRDERSDHQPAAPSRPQSDLGDRRAARARRDGDGVDHGAPGSARRGGGVDP